MSTVRERRLRSDYERLGTLISAHKSNLAIECARGNPPETFIVAFTASSIVEVKGNDPVLRHHHRLKIEMAADYPAIPPLVTVLGQIFHPHVWPQNNVVCLGPWKITETLDNLVLRLFRMLVYDPEQLNWKSVANQEAAIWASRNKHLFPLGRLGERTSPSVVEINRWSA